jgi:hypothetical protein
MTSKVIDIYEWRRPGPMGCAIPMMVTPTQNEKNEWARLAQAAYRQQCNEIGHTFSVAASLPHDEQITVKRFDELQSNYRQWLIYGKVTLKNGMTVAVLLTAIYRCIFNTYVTLESGD